MENDFFKCWKVNFDSEWWLFYSDEYDWWNIKILFGNILPLIIFEGHVTVGQELYQKIALLLLFCFSQLLGLKNIHIGSFLCSCLVDLSTVKKNISWLDAVIFFHAEFLVFLYSVIFRNKIVCIKAIW